MDDSLQPAARPPRWRARLTTALLLGAFVAGMAVQFRTGLADNGDFTRSIKFFSAGPVGIRPNFPPPHTALWQQRFFRYWLPEWSLRDHRYEKVVSSSVLLWMPGVLLAAAASLPEVSLPWLSLVPRTLLFGELWLLLWWAGRQRQGRWLPWTLGVPLVLMLTTTDNAAFLNSFYQEAGSQVFILPVLFSLVYLKARPTRGRLALAVGCVGLLALAKSSAIYWPLLVLPFGLYAWIVRDPTRWRGHWRAILAFGLAAACLLTAAARGVTSYHEANVNPYHSLFCGALVFSHEPAAHLRRLGLSDGADCIGVSAYRERGQAFFETHQRQMNFGNTLSTVAHEPFIAWRMGWFGLCSMQDISLEYLGKFAPGDSRSGDQAAHDGSPDASEERVWDAASESEPANLWSNLKFHLFPTGGWLALTLAGFAAFCGWRLREPGAAGALAFIGLLTTLATVADVAVALLGEGRHELIKHLYFANLLFDLALIACLSGALLWAVERMTDDG